MAENIRHSSDIPDFDTYPASPAVEGGPETAGRRSQLEQRGAELGAAAGKVVRRAKQAKTKAQKLPDPLVDRLSELGEQARARAEYVRIVATQRAGEFADAARARTNELGRQLREKAYELRAQAKVGLGRVRTRSAQVANDYPVHVALGAAAAGFLLGVGLRIRRANRAY